MSDLFDDFVEARDRRGRLAPEFWTAPGLPDAEIPAAARALLGPAPPATGHVLHLGCGDGRITAALLQPGLRVSGLDWSPAMIEAATCRSGPDLSFLGWSAPPALPPVAQGADLVCLDPTLTALPLPAFGALLQGVAVALRPGAVVRWPIAVADGLDDQAPAGDTVSPRPSTASAAADLARASGLVPRGLPNTSGHAGEFVWMEAVRGDGAVPAAPRPSWAPAPADEALEAEYALWLYAADELAMVGNVPGAEACLEAAGALLPTRREAWIQWTMHRLHQGDLKGASVLVEAWTEARPEDHEAWLRRAELAEAREAPAEAREALTALDGLGPIPAPLRDAVAELAAHLPPAD